MAEEADAPQAHYYEWEGGDSCGTVFDVDEVFDVLRYADRNGLSVREAFKLFGFPDQRLFADTATYDLGKPSDA